MPDRQQGCCVNQTEVQNLNGSFSIDPQYKFSFYDSISHPNALYKNRSKNRFRSIFIPTIEHQLSNIEYLTPILKLFLRMFNQHLVHHAIFFGFFGCHPIITVAISFNLCIFLTAMKGNDIV